MKLSNLHLYQSELREFGLEEIKLSKLSNVVALVGRNGSGKSRIIRAVHQYLQNLDTIKYVNSIENHPNRLASRIQMYRSSAKIVREKSELDRLSNLIEYEPNNSEFQLLFNNAKNAYQVASKEMNFNAQQKTHFTHINNFNKDIKDISKHYFKWIKQSDINALNENFSDGTVKTFEDLLEKVSDSDSYDELLTLYGSGLTFLLELPAKLAFDKYETEGDEKKFKNRTAYRRFSKLKSLFEDFIGKDLTWERKGTSMTPNGRNLHLVIEGIWKINGREFNYTEFSDGEKTLFGYVLLFFLLDLNPDVRLKESILFIDEPELHLHPNSEIQLIDAIRNIIGEKGQLWIATHSINILSHLNPEEIFMIKAGKIFHPAEATPQNSLNELMGLEDRVHKLGEFVTSITSWAYVNFMTQCFFNPEVIDHAAENDPQIEVFKKSIQSTKSKTLLDFGAGKGRLFERIKKDENFSRIKYSALEPYSTLHGDLKALGVAEIYDDYKLIPENSFDQVVLCNVLHEIPLLDLVPTLNRIIKVLKPEGYLVIIEDRFLPKGEKIGETGFLLFEEPELKNLFNLNEKPHVIQSNNDKYTDRIMCAVLCKTELPNQITKKNVQHALSSLKENTLERIKQLRNPKSSEMIIKGISKGRRSGLYSQLYINAVLSEELLTN